MGIGNGSGVRERLRGFHGIRSVFRFSAAALSLALMLSLGGCAWPSELIADAGTKALQGNNDKSATTTLRIAAQPYPLYSDVWVAHELGYLKDELGKVNAGYTWDSFKSGPLVNEAMAAGNEDIGYAADLPAIIAKSTGQDVTIVSNVAYGEKALAIMVPADSTITSVADLKGRKVGYATGSYAQHLLALRLAEQGLTLDDVQTANLSAEDQVAAIQSHSVDAIVIWEQYVTQLESEGTAKVLADGTGVKRGNMVSYATTAYAKKNPAVIRAYNRAVQRGADLIAKDPDKAANAVAKDFGVSADMLKRIWTHLTFTTELKQDDIDAITQVSDFAWRNGILKSQVDVNALIDTDFVTATNGSTAADTTRDTGAVAASHGAATTSTTTTTAKE
ncbi:aliphatic sulfonate ABC transporter substrate-binding protein [Bifidobacterium callimiconis]|uniref:Putative aliphatic sulfonates-binding protein n=1 Tax=Bifidobacterium callimiconis TaxID=2306973 RepID=A0A430FB73_9BIFI|nr:aliphatic sulfonate ABC transporter substrate-binding protein [Bifidobacterium callimiconis]MBT1177761.1 aliphatic sulfonate ABC transporter substrate-binding protein [Bifidobacterium callimiconis]RSX50083.1 ABC transporter substrate-binding protein [Bifidobacterium callimiconis]